VPEELHILIVEDEPNDAKLMEYELKSAGMTFVAKRVETKEAFLSALSMFSPDIILSDYSLPAFDGLTALRIARDRIPDTPFVFVTGALGEELAIELLKQGATDYVLKDRLSRLPIEVSRALREVQERKESERAQAALRRTEELLRKVATAVEQAAESVMIVDIDGKVEYVNPAFTQISGYADSDITGREPAILRSADHAERFYDETWSALKAGAVWKGRVVRKKKDGSIYHVEETASPVKDSCGAVVNYVFVSRDMTEQVRLEEQLLQSQKMEALGALAGGIAHDFNNILAAMIGFSELAADDIPVDGQAQRRLKRVHEAGLRGRELVKQILAFSRKSEGERKQISLVPLIRETHALLRASLPTAIKMPLAIATGDDCVFADATQIQQVLMNLATNAADAMQGRGQLTIGVSSVAFPGDSLLPDPGMAPGAYVKLTVKDTGVGMTEEVRQRIFEPFFTTKEPGKGSGMGLAVVYGIVTSHGGAVTVQSKVGRGSIFDVFLPWAQKPDVDKAEETTFALPTGDERILFVDDEEMLVEMARDMLESLGYRVTVAKHPTDAWTLFLEDPSQFDLVITDQNLPGATGITLARDMLRVREEMPIILWTGYGEMASADKTKEIGISEFVMKPVVKKELAETIRRVLDTKTQGETSPRHAGKRGKRSRRYKSS
jgi:PAS domain S-box-containing protein